ncbi:MAG: hypothetical protein WAW75_04235 [Gallionella sp.]
MRPWHPIRTWECVKAGLYADSPPRGMDADDARNAYAVFLADLSRFRTALERVLVDWPISCEQFLSNASINRIAWLGQASMCIETGVPCKYRSGFALLTEAQQAAANATAAEALRKWEAKTRYFQLLLPDPPKPIRGMQAKVAWYQQFWGLRGYAKDFPEDVPHEVASKQYAPSWKAIAVAILSNDVTLQSLGFSGPQSQWYSFLKQVELSERSIGAI